MTTTAGTWRDRYFVLTILTATQTGTSLLSQGIGSLAPFIAGALTLNRTQIGLMMGVMGAAWVVTSPVAGVIVDRFGERRIILASGLAMVLVLLAAAAVENFLWLLLWLVPSAVLMCFQTPAGGRAIMQWFKEDRALAMGIRQTGAPIGGFLGAIVLVPIAAVAGYRASLVATAGIVLVTTLMILLLRGHPERPPEEGTRFRALWSRMRSIAVDRRSLLMSITQMDHIAAQMCVLSFLTISLIATAHLDIPSAVFAFALSQVGSITGRFLWGILSDFVWDHDRMLPTIYSTVIGAVSTVAIAFPYAEPTFGVKLLLDVAAFLLGISIAGCNGIFAMAQTEVAGHEFAGSALGVANARSAMSAMVAPPIFGVLADATGYTVSWLVLAAIIALGLVPACAARRLLRGVPAT